METCLFAFILKPLVYMELFINARLSGGSPDSKGGLQKKRGGGRRLLPKTQILCSTHSADSKTEMVGA